MAKKSDKKKKAIDSEDHRQYFMTANNPPNKAVMDENLPNKERNVTHRNTTSNTSDEDIKIIKSNLDKLERALVCADENGLFKEINEPKFMEIIEIMASALELIEDQTTNVKYRVIEAWQEYRKANNLYYQAINSVSPWWRFQHQFGGPFVAYFFILLGFTFIGWFYFGESLSAVTLLFVPLWAYLWGLVGGVLQGFWFLWQHVSDRKMRKAWTPWYLLLPFMGALLGAIMYLIFSAGFIAATGGGKIESESIVMLLSVLAGFSTKWAVESLDKVTSLIKIGK